MKPAAIGVDLVDVASFGEQLGQEGSVFHQVFTAREWNAAARFTPEQGASACEASEALSPSRAASGLSMRSIQSLAARWAAKEAFIKAWSSLYYGHEDPLERDQVDWAEPLGAPFAALPRSNCRRASANRKRDFSFTHMACFFIPRR